MDSLYFIPGACSKAVHILCRELDLEIELKRVRKSDKTELLTVNPLGLVPVWVESAGTVVREVSTILQYICQREEDARFFDTQNTRHKYQVMERLGFVATELHKTFVPFFAHRGQHKQETLDIFKDDLLKKLQYIDGLLSSYPFFAGQTYSIADMYLIVVLDWCQYIDLNLSVYEHINKWMTLIKSRSAFIEATTIENDMRTSSK